MKTHCKVLLSCIILFFLLIPIHASAHAGRTGSDGGHIDSDTGEYHFHHGYSAHDHCDIDGDGIIDCPYDFVDKTGENSGTNSNPSGSTSTNQPIKESTTSLNQSTKESSTNKKEEEEVPAWVYWVFAGQAVAIICLLISNSVKKNTIEAMESSHKFEIDAVNKACDKKIEERQASDAELQTIQANIADAQKAQKALLDEQNDLLNEISHQNKEILRLRRLRCRVKDAPLDVSFSKNGMPVFWKPNKYKPYGDYTVFVSQKSDIYHTDRLCSGFYAREDHIFNVMDRYKPCKKCAVRFFDFTSVPDWYAQRNAPVQKDIFDDPSIKVNWRDQ